MIKSIEIIINMSREETEERKNEMIFRDIYMSFK